MHAHLQLEMLVQQITAISTSLQIQTVDTEGKIYLHKSTEQKVCVLCSICTHNLYLIRFWFAKAAANYIIGD